MTMKIIDDLIGTKVIVRSSESGVHHGILQGRDEGAVHLKNSRRLWYWEIAGEGVSLSEVAIQGIKQDTSTITMELPDLVVLGACEIIPAHGLASATIEGAPIGKAK